MLAKAGSPEQQTRFFRQLVSGESCSAYFTTEPARENCASFDPGMLCTTCWQQGHHWANEGRKAFLTGVDGATVGIILAKSGDGACMFLMVCLIAVPRAAPAG